MQKKILHVVNISFVLPYYIGEQFDYFKKKGIEFYVACSPSEHLLSYAKKKQITPFPIQILREINFVQDLKSIFKLIKLIKRNNIDIVIGHTPKGAMIAMIAAFFAGVSKRIYFRHGLMYETSFGLKRNLLIWIERLTGLLATKVVCVSPSVLRISNHQKLNSTRKNLLLNIGTCNGINVNWFGKERVSEVNVKEIASKSKIESHHQVIGYVGRLVNDKGINELIEAWKILLSKYNNIKLLLVGPFEERDSISEELKQYIRDEPTIIHTGLINDTSLYYQLMSVFVLPSHREGFPTVVLEASSMQLPVLTTKVTGCIDSIIEGVTGEYISKDPHDIAAKIAYYLDNKEIALAHGLNGRTFVQQHFAQEKIWDEIESKVLELKNIEKINKVKPI